MALGSNVPFRSRGVSISNWDYHQVLVETDGTINLFYTFGTDLVGLDAGIDLYTYHTDALGSTRVLTDSIGQVTDDVRYDAWGEKLVGGAVPENQYPFASERLDRNLNQYYLRARNYSQIIGRFTQQDTFQGIEEETATLHKYLYAGNDPVLMTDPGGHLFGLGGIVSSSIRGVLSTATRASSSAARFLRVGRVNGKTVQLSLRSRVWLQRTVGKVQKKLPKDMGKGIPGKKKVKPGKAEKPSWRWEDGKGNGVRVDRGNPKSSSPSQRPGHVVVNSGGKIIGRNGKPIGGSTKNNPKDAHIPLSEWLGWRSWNKP